MCTTEMGFWAVVGYIADIVGILGFIVSGATLFFTCRIRKEMLKHVEKSDYRQDIDQQIESLLSIQKLLSEKNSPVEDLFSEAEIILSELRSYYETILPKSFLKEIAACSNFISAHTPQHSPRDVRDVQKKLISIIAKLKKEKKVL